MIIETKGENSFIKYKFLYFSIFSIFLYFYGNIFKKILRPPTKINNLNKLK